MEQEGGMKIKMKKQTMLKISFVLFFITVAITFWADWRIGLALLVYEAYRMFDEMITKDELRESLARETLGKILADAIRELKGEGNNNAT